MAEAETDRDSFVTYLESIRDKENRGALAVLRRGAGKSPGSQIDMYPYVVPWLPKNPTRWQESKYFIIASLFATHPEKGGTGNLGDVMRKIKETTGSDSVEKRFVALLNCHPDDLHLHLRHAVSLASSKKIPIDWHRLSKDITFWNSENNWTQKSWAKAFWSQETVKKEKASEDKAKQN